MLYSMIVALAVVLLRVDEVGSIDITGSDSSILLTCGVVSEPTAAE